MRLLKMREVKFREWQHQEKKMYHIDLHNEALLSTNKHDVLMQRTGLKDKNGVEIYEGDIVQTKYGNHIIDWNSELCRFGFRRLQERIKWVMNITALDEYEVIGNIYENKELLNESKL